MNLWEKKKLALICFLVIIGVGLALGSSESIPKTEESHHVQQAQRQQAMPTPVLVSVYISGAVKKPGVYDVPAGMRTLDAIKMAGGITAEAAVHKVNMVRKCKDGLHINVPFLVQSKKKNSKENSLSPKPAQAVAQPMSQTAAESKQAEGRKVNLNTATQQELESLKGIGKATAAAIIRYRDKARFYNIEDLQKVPGIGPAKFAAIRESIEV